MKSSRINLRVSDEEKAAWTIAAGEKPLSEWLRGLANQEAETKEGLAPVFVYSESFGHPAIDLSKAPLGEILGQCARWMHHRKGVFCGSCGQTQ